MKYKFEIYGSTWEVHTTGTERRVVCQGPLPYNPAAGFNLFKALRLAEEADNDQAVMETMKDWIGK